MILGLIAGLVAVNFDAAWLVVDWVKPFGTIFINLLKMIAAPLIIVSLVKGVSDMRDLGRLWPSADGPSRSSCSRRWRR